MKLAETKALKRRSELKDMEAMVTKMLSNDKKTELEIDRFEEMLK